MVFPVQWLTFKLQYIKKKKLIISAKASVASTINSTEAWQKIMLKPLNILYVSMS